MDRIPFTLLPRLDGEMTSGSWMEHCRENGNLGLFLDQYDEDGHKSLRATCNTVQSHENVRLLVEAKQSLIDVTEPAIRP